MVIPVDLFEQDHMIRHGGLELCALLVVVDGNLVLHICVLRILYPVGVPLVPLYPYYHVIGIIASG